MSTHARSASPSDRFRMERPGIGAFFVDELRQQFRSKGLWICFLIMALMFYRYVSESYWDELVGSGRVPVNSPIVIYYIFAFSTYWAAIFATAFMTSPLLRDLRYSVAPIVYAMPFRDRDYFIGKYLAGQAALLFVMSGVFVGFMLLSWLQPSLGPESLHSYMPMPWGQAIHSFALFLLPACFFFGSVHFALAALSGRMTPSYAFAVIVTLVFLSFELSFQGDTFAKRWPEILDPVGYITLQGQVFYWTAEQRMAQYIRLNETMLLNRGLYVGLGALALLVLSRRANLRGLLDRSRGRRRDKRETVADVRTSVTAGNRINMPPPTAQNKSRPGRAALAMLQIGWEQFRRCAYEIWFIVALAAGFVMAFSLSLRIGALYRLPEGNLLPTALDILDQPVEMYVIVGIIVVAFAVGEILSRERITRVQQIMDSCPASNWFLIGSKLVACSLVVLTFTLAPALATLSVQLLKGYHDIEWTLYLYRFVYGVLPSLATYAAIAAVFHIVANQRAVGHALATIACFSVFMMEEIEVVENPLLLLGYPVLIPLTTFDALEQFNAKLLQLNAYNMAIGATLLILAAWIWPRGVETGLPRRLRTMLRNVGTPSVIALAVGAGVVATAGGTVYRTINAEGDYKTIEEKKRFDARHEQHFGDLAMVPQPKVIAADISVDLHPGTRRMQYEADLTLQNKHRVPVSQLELITPPFTQISCVAEGTACLEPSFVDPEFRRSRFSLAPPLAPGQRRQIRIEASGQFDGYSNEGFRGSVVRQGSFMTEGDWPAMGYDRSKELSLLGDRRFHKLGARSELPTSDLAPSVQDFAVSSQADLLSYNLTIATDEGQHAIAPGNLINAETSNGRSVFHYAGEDAVWNFTIASATYHATHENPIAGDGSDATIVAYHLPNHSYNVGRYLAGARAALDRFSAQFGPLPYSEIRFVEVPLNLAGKARTSGNTVFLPEKDGWLHDYREPQDRDWVLYTAAREVARMWWGQQVIPGEMKGSVVLTGSIPEYLALRVIEQAHGRDAALDLLAMKRDIYLRQRVKEDAVEPALLDAEDAAYLDEKGLLALFSARNIIGAERLDAALAAYFREARLKHTPPYANAIEFVEALKSFAPSETQRQALAVVFTETTLYDFRLRSARIQAGTAANHTLLLEIDAERFDVTAHSNHAPTAFSVAVPVEVIGDDPPAAAPFNTVLTLENGRNTLTLQTPFAATRVLIDPAARFVELNARDNVKHVVR